MLRQRQTEVALSNVPGSAAMPIFFGKNELGQRDGVVNDKPAVTLSLEAWDALVTEHRAKKKRSVG